MKSFWRTLLVWLTVLAMPIQGMAAASMLHCAPRNAPTHQYVVSHDHVGLGGHVHSGHIESANAQAPADVDAADNGVSAQPIKSKASSAGHKCSACAACCAAAALPAAAPEVPIPDHGCETTLAPAIGSTSFIASGPERPPRHRLA